jgi:uncharacterized membrane protein YdbT with pleckstrin-like domain
MPIKVDDVKELPMVKGYVQRMLAEGERIIVITRQHWFVVASAIFFESVMILVALIALIAGVFFVKPIHDIGKLIIFLACLGIIIIFGLSMLRDILIWWNRQYIITSLRVIQISGVINKNLTDSSLEKVNDVKLTQSILGRIFGYGDVEILTASELGANLFRRIGNPVGFKTAMLNAKQDIEHDGEDIIKHRDDIPSLISQLEQLHKKGVLTDEEFTRKKQELLAKI